MFVGTEESMNRRVNIGNLKTWISCRLPMPKLVGARRRGQALIGLARYGTHNSLKNSELPK